MSVLTEITLYDAYAEIIDAVETTLKAETEAGGLLNEVISESKRVLVGEKQKQAIKPPVLWLHGLSAVNNQPPQTLHLGWNLPLLMIGIAQSNSPHDGYDEAAHIAGAAVSTMLRQARLRPALGVAYVSDIIATGFDPNADETVDEERGRLFAATGSVTVRFSIVEPSQ